MKKQVHLFIILQFAISLFCGQAFSTTLTVSSVANTGANTFRQAVIDAAANDTIIFSGTTNGQLIQLNSQITINKPLVIIGNGIQNTILDGGNGINFRLLAISSPCTITHIKFQNGGGDVTGVTNTGLWGGAINYNYSVGDSLKMDHCRFENNKAYLGGAIRVQEGQIDLSFCSFSGNESFKFGGAINTRGSSNFTSFISHCTFYQNSTSERGGAIYAESGNSLIVIYSNFVQNSSGTTGGGFDRGGSDHNITGSIFYNNTAVTLGNDISSTSANIFGLSNLLSDYTGSGLTLGAFGNISGDPAFQDISNENFRLKANSVAINATGVTLFNGVDKDFYGSMRVNDGLLDIGAAEFPLRFYVNENASGSNDGSAWADAFQDLNAALTLAVKGTNIWVAKGVYERPSSFRNTAFTIPDSVKIFGGFAGTEANTYDLTLRDMEINKTTLSGERGTVGDTTDNHYHVVKTVNVSKETLLDGFTIRDGNADYNSVSILDDIGGGWYNEASGMGNTSNPTVRNCIFENNNADNAGGGMGSYGTFFGEAGAITENCIFRGNSTTFSGGGLYFSELTDNTEITIHNSAFVGNRAGVSGGGLYVASSATNLDVNVLHCSFVSNVARFGGGIYARTRSGVFNVTLKNTLTTANRAFAYSSTDLRSAIQLDNGTTSQFEHSFIENNTDVSNGNILGTQDPLVLNAPSAFSSPNLAVDFRLVFCSPLINNGTSSGALTTDVFGKTRVGVPDIGAFEFTGTLSSVIYVDDDAGVSGSGSSWTDALPTIQEALQLRAICPNIDTIWVAAGTYYPTQGTDRNVSFNIPDNVRLFGGFSGVEPDTYNLELRDFTVSPSILSGNINAQNDSTDNSFHVVRMNNVSSSTLLDGFTVTHGHATGAAFSDQLDGAGIYNDGKNGVTTSPTIRNCTFSNNYARGGAGIYNNGFAGESSPLIENCTFINNQASSNGAGLANSGIQGGVSNAVVKNCFFRGNNAKIRGAGISNSCGGGSCAFEVSGSVFSGNVSDLGGAGIRNTGAMNLTVTNCTFTGNYAGVDAAGIESNQVLIDNSIKIQNCIFWKNFSSTNTGVSAHIANFDSSDDISYCMFEGVSSSADNNVPSIDPLFVQGIEPSITPSTLGDFALKICSPVADKGNNAAIGVDYTLDIAKKTRLVNATNAGSAIVDLGAYEFQGGSFPNFVNITSDITSDTIEGSSGIMEASSTVTNPNRVLYNAQNHVLLKPGFEAQTGAIFTAIVGPFTCPD